MFEKLSYCGLVCSACPIYLATREEDSIEQARLREEIAQLCQTVYNKDYTALDITDCDGCRAEGGRLFPSCRICPIRSCARHKHVDHCGLCGEYPCAELGGFFITEQAAQARLEEARRSAAGQIGG